MNDIIHQCQAIHPSIHKRASSPQGVIRVSLEKKKKLGRRLTPTRSHGQRRDVTSPACMNELHGANLLAVKGRIKLAEFFPKKSEVAKISEPARRRSPIFFRTFGTKLGPKNFDW